MKPSTICGYRDEACKRKKEKEKEKEKKVGQNFAPLNDNAMQVFDNVAQKSGRNWLGRLGRAFSNALSGGASAPAKGNSFLASDLNRSAGNFAPAASNNTAASAAPVMPPPTFGSFLEAKLDPRYRVGGAGEDLFSGNYNFSLPLVSLPGRAGLDLNITLSYNSLVWIRWANIMSFDYDYFATMTPGFRIGFPEIQGPYVLNGVNTYVVYLPSGRRVEMRQVEPNKFEAIDSSYLYLDVNAIDPTQMTLYSTDGTQYKYERPFGGNSPSRCTQIKDSNGNYISIIYKNVGDPQYPLTVFDKVIDTLGREIIFDYDGDLHLLKIRQIWNGQEFIWAQFEYGSKYVAPNFGGLYVDGPNNVNIPVITRVITGDGARHTFAYSSWGQVESIGSYGEADNHRASVFYAFPSTATSQSDCPRFTQRNDGVFAWPGEVYDQQTGFGWAINYFYFEPNEAYGQMTGPDGVTHREIFSVSGNTRGLTTRTEAHHGGAIQQFTDLTWASDSVSSPPLRPRVTEIKICDDRNHDGAYQSGTDKLGKTTIQYTTLGSTIRLPWIVWEYNEGGGSVYRSTKTDYAPDADYLNRRIIGLPNFTYLYEGNLATLKAQTEYVYDATLESGTDFVLGHPSVPRQHDSAYGTAFRYRGNLSKTRRYSVVGGTAGSPIETRTDYYLTGAVAMTKDGENHQTTISYDDSFLHYTEPSPGTLNVVTISPSPATYAYPTKVTVDETPADLSSRVSYNYDFGAVTRAVDPKAYAAAGGGDPQTMRVSAYDSKGRLEKSLIWKNGAKHSHMKYVYGNDHNWVQTFTTVNSLAEEAVVLHLLDGIGRERIVINEHPGSQGGLSAYYRAFDKMGRVGEQSRPTEIDAATWAPTRDDSSYIAGTQTFDWKGRPKTTTNLDGTTRTINYTGCGCAGSDVTELIDEVGRKQQVYRDVFGRAEKTESLNLGGGVYSTQTNAYNIRDQITQVSQIAGTSGASQITTRQYDGYGRLWKSRAPIATGDTIYEYYDDDTVKKVTDPRESSGVFASATFIHNSRHLVQDITYTVPAGVADTPNVHYGYDENGSRNLMNDGLGTITYAYDELNRMTSETRQFTATFGQYHPALPGTYKLTYDYNLAGQVKRVGYESSNHPGDNGYIDYAFDKVGKMTGVTGSLFAGATNYSTEMKYTAWDELKSLTYGNTRKLTASYTARQQLQSFKLKKQDGTPVMDKAYQYYADGRIKFSDDAVDFRDLFDRAFRYDQVGRLEEAWTGVQARNYINQLPIGTDDVPYHLSYQYDVWGNQLSQSGKYWSTALTEPVATYQNMRRDGWQYDAAGNITQEVSNSLQYDAAGRNVSVGAIVTGPESTQSFDGDGLAGRRDPRASEPIFYMRSTALGGKVITEINGMGTNAVWAIPRGAKLRSHVYNGETRVATQEVMATTPITQEMIWRYIDPITGTEINDGGLNEMQEPDPLGGNVGLNDPELVSPPDPDTEQPDLFGGGGFNPNHVTYTLDGIRISERLALDLFSGPIPMAAVAPANEVTTVIRHGKPRLAIWQAFGDGYQGYVPVGAKYIGNGQIGSDGVSVFKGSRGKSLYARYKGDTDLAKLNGATGEAVLGRSMSFGLQQGRRPIRPKPQPTPTPQTDNTASTSVQSDQNQVFVCSRPADIRAGGVNINPFGISHRWIKTSTKEAGLGPANGEVPGQGGGSDSPYVSLTAIVDHTGQSLKPGATCKVAPNVNVDRVNSVLQIGEPRGVWGFGTNDCWTFCEEVIFYGRYGFHRNDLERPRIFNPKDR